MELGTVMAGRRSRAAASMITSRLVAVSGLGVNDEPAIWFSREFLEDSLDIVGVPHAGTPRRPRIGRHQQFGTA
jgi:hypothetical protein